MTLSATSTRKRKIPRPTDPTDYTPFFAYKRVASPQGQLLHCEGVALTRLADAVGTPTYVYSRASIEAAYRRLDRAFGSLPHRLCYAVKANSNLSVLRVLANLGSSFDIVSGGELDRLKRVGISGKRIVFSGVGKTRDEIRAALRYRASRAAQPGILIFNIESGAELELLLSEDSRAFVRSEHAPICGDSRESRRSGRRPSPHRHRRSSSQIRHRLAGSSPPLSRKQGLSLACVARDQRTPRVPNLQHVSISPRPRCALRLTVRDLARNGIRLDHVDIGGGLGIRYTDESPLAPEKYAKVLSQIVRPLGCTLLVEPGRTLVGPSGVLLTRMLYVKQNRGKTFVVVDAAMNDLIRPALYSATHPITPAIRSSSAAGREIQVDVVGPVCESGDFFVRDWPLAARSARRSSGYLGGGSLQLRAIIELQCAPPLRRGFSRGPPLPHSAKARNLCRFGPRRNHVKRDADPRH